MGPAVSLTEALQHRSNKRRVSAVDVEFMGLGTFWSDACLGRTLHV